MSGSINFTNLAQLNFITSLLDTFLCAFLSSSCWLADERPLHCTTPGARRLYRNIPSGVVTRTCHLGLLLTTLLLILWETLTCSQVSREDNVVNGPCDTLTDTLLVARSALYRIFMLELFRSTGTWVLIVLPGFSYTGRRQNEL